MCFKGFRLTQCVINFVYLLNLNGIPNSDLLQIKRQDSKQDEFTKLRNIHPSIEWRFLIGNRF